MKKILIADNTDTWREVMRETLPEDYQVYGCADGTAAWEITEHERPDVLVLDLMIPGKNVLGILKELSAFPDRPRTIITGRYVSDHVHAALERYRVDLILMKPCEAQDLAERITEMLCEHEPLLHRGAYDPIMAILVELGIRTSQQGFRFLRTGMELLMEDPNQMLTKHLYPAIAAQHNTSAGNVEKGIRTAIGSAWKRRRNDVWRRYFAPAPNGEIPKPTSGQFLFQLTDALISSRNRRA
ncbi:MAG: response regulator [Oscillospiraceae bacterium]|nr:response regulator [Oscillospiraceae bacterium]